MAIVPTYDLKERPAVGAGTAPTQYRDYSGMIPKADQMISAAAGNTAKALVKYQNEVDDARADGVYAQMQQKAIDLEDAYKQRKGENALQPDEQGRGLVDQNQDDLKDYFNQLTEGLSPGAKARAQRKVNSIFLRQYATATAHVRTQSDTYNEQVDKAVVSSQINAARTNYDDPLAITINAETAKNQLAKAGARHGWDQATRTQAERSALDAVVSSGIGGMLDKAKEDPAYAVMARGYFETYKDQLSGSAAAKLNTAITAVQDNHQLDAEKAQAIRDLTVARVQLSLPGSSAAKATGITPGSSSEWFLTSIVPGESGGEQFENDGRVKVGRYPDGSRPKDKANWAYGVSQITIPAAREAAKSLGEKLDEQKLLNDKDYNLRMGQAYFDFLLSHYSGDAVKATAAYHSGYAAVDKLIKERGGDWLSGLGPIGQAYVKKAQERMDAARSGVRKDSYGNVIHPFDPRYVMSSPQYFTQADALKWAMDNSTRAQQNPEYRDKLVDKIMSQRNSDIGDDRQQQANLVSQAQDYIAQGQDVPPGLLAQMTVATQNALADYKKKLETYDDSGNIALAAYYLSTPEALNKLSEVELKNMLPALPKDYRKQVEWAYYKGKVKAVNAADKQAQNSKEAQAGQINPDFYVSYDWAKDLVKDYTGKDAWKNIKPEDQAQYIVSVMRALSREAQIRGIKFKKKSEVASLFNDVVATTRFTVPGFFGPSDKTIFSVTKSDLGADNRPDTAWGVVKQIVQANHTRDGNPNPPSDGQVMAAFQDIMMGFYPDVNLRGLTMDKTVTDYLESQAKAEKRTLTPLQELQAYLKFLVDQKKVPKASVDQTLDEGRPVDIWAMTD